jgi:hypothetical protein
VANPQKPNPADYLSRMRNLFLRMSGIVRQLLDKFGSQRVAAIRFPVPFGPKSITERRRFLSPIYKLIRYHRLIFDSVADGVFRSTYLPWIDSITHVKAGEKEEIELDNVMCRSRWSHDEGQTIYGHAVLKRISQTGMTPEVNIVRGILPECFITYVSRRFPEVKEVRDLVASNEINYKLLEAVSDRIELGVADVVSMFRLQSKVQAGFDE